MDAFAQIAKNGIQGRHELLIQPEPCSPPEETLELKECHCLPLDIPSKISSPEELSDELSKKREWARSFLENHAPQLQSCRKTITLDHFLWKNQNDSTWKPVNLPHYGGPLGAARTFYQTTFSLQEISSQIFVVINGADYKAAVFVNDQLAGTHEGFFATFEFDITDLVHPGENTLRIQLENDYVMIGNRSDNDPTVLVGDKIYAATGPGYDDPALGWHHCPPGMGLLDTVQIEQRSSLFIHEIFTRTLDQEIEFWVEAVNCLYQPQKISFSLSVYGQNHTQAVVEDVCFVPSTGKQLGLGDTFTEVIARREGTLNASLPLPCHKGRNLYKLRIPAQQMRWWSPEQPWLYQAQLTLKDENGQILDTFCQQFGRRTFTQDLESQPKGMFYLNGRPTRLRGANTMGFEQQDVMQGDDNQLIDDILLAKLCNMNFWRITQRPVQRKIYDYCDRLGLMIQTDLPLFGCLRRHKFCEAVRQAEEMERHIRRHACCVLVSYINEPFPNASNLPSMNLERNELEHFFDAADIVVRLNNPDRVIKHVDGDYDPPSNTLPDNHCYPMWYNGHGIDIGKLHKGFWMPVKPGWYYGCGEFGCEGLEDWDLMQERYPKEWLLQPDEAASDWDPARIVRAQTADFYHFFYDRPSSPERWVSESQAFQALATRMMTEAFRRDSRMVTFAIHLFIDAFPSGWMKAIMDCRRTPKLAFFAYRNALEPIMVSLRADKTQFFGGENAKAEVWICNDTDTSGEYFLRHELICDGMVIASAQQSAQLGCCTSLYTGTLQFRLPHVSQRKQVQLRSILLSADGSRLAWNQLDYVLHPVCPPAPVIQIRRIEDITAADLAAVEQGKILWVDQPGPGDYTLAGHKLHVQESGMSPMHFASAKTGHKWVSGFLPEDFRHWYNAKEDCIVPLAECTVQADGFASVLTSRNLGPDGSWQPAALVCERSLGKGRIVLSQISYEQMCENPAGQILLSRIG